MITGTIKHIDIDENGNIRVLTDYKDANGILIQTGTTRYSTHQDETQAELEERIKREIDDHCQTLLRRQHFKGKNVDTVSSLKINMIGHKREHSTAVHTFGQGKKKVVLDEKNIIEEVKD